MKFLVVVDMQKDFVDGSLGTPEAVAILPNVAAKIVGTPAQQIFVTLDTHGPDYLTRCEGRHLPVEHCIAGTPGHALHPAIAPALADVAPTIGWKNPPSAPWSWWSGCAGPPGMRPRNLS